jgi:hypothetical protein
MEKKGGNVGGSTGSGIAPGTPPPAGGERRQQQQQDIPIGVPVSEEEYRRLKEEAEKRRPCGTARRDQTPDR